MNKAKYVDIYIDGKSILVDMIDVHGLLMSDITESIDCICLTDILSNERHIEDPAVSYECKWMSLSLFKEADYKYSGKGESLFEYMKGHQLRCISLLDESKQRIKGPIYSLGDQTSRIDKYGDCIIEIKYKK